MPALLSQYSNYLLHLLTGLAMLAVFAPLYTRITPFNEFAMIREGRMAAAYSFTGALIGFCLPVAYSIASNDAYPVFVMWAVSAMVVQLLAYAVTSRLFVALEEGLADNNIAMGVLMGGISLAVGIINAACMS